MKIKAKPLSDKEIADRLGEGGLKIARRTIAKYRDQLSIPSQRYRKEIWVFDKCLVRLY